MQALLARRACHAHSPAAGPFPPAHLVRGAGRVQLPGAVPRVGGLLIQQPAVGGHHACHAGFQAAAASVRQRCRQHMATAGRASTTAQGCASQPTHWPPAAACSRKRTLPLHFVAVPQPARAPGVGQHVAVASAPAVLRGAARVGVDRVRTCAARGSGLPGRARRTFHPRPAAPTCTIVPSHHLPAPVQLSSFQYACSGAGRGRPGHSARCCLHGQTERSGAACLPAR